MSLIVSGGTLNIRSLFVSHTSTQPLSNITVKRIRLSFSDIELDGQGVGLDHIRGYASNDATGSNLLHISLLDNVAASSIFHSTYDVQYAFDAQGEGTGAGWGATWNDPSDQWIEATLPTPIALGSITFKKDSSFRMWRTSFVTILVEDDTGSIHQVTVPWNEGQDTRPAPLLTTLDFSTINI